MTSVKGFIQLAREERDRKKHDEYLARAEQEADRAILLAHNLQTEIEAKAIQYGEGLSPEQ